MIAINLKGGKDTKDVTDTRQGNESREVMTVLDRARKGVLSIFSGVKRGCTL